MRARVTATINTDSSGTGILKNPQRTIPPQRGGPFIGNRPRKYWGALRVATWKCMRRVEVRAAMGEDHKSLGCDTGPDFPARYLAQSKVFQLWHRSCEVHNNIVIHS